MDGKSGAEDLLAKVLHDPALLAALAKHAASVNGNEAVIAIGTDGKADIATKAGS
jgi:hypothetical protein